MTFQQGAAFAIVLGTMALLVWGRIRYDLVALLALLVSIAAGIVAPDKAFAGFGDEIVIIVASALLVSAAVARSGVVERLMRPVNPYLTDVRAQVFTLVMAVTLLSAFMKNIGALAIFMPVAVLPAHADGLRLAPRRADDFDRHVAEHHRVRAARRDRRSALPDVRFPA